MLFSICFYGKFRGVGMKKINYKPKKKFMREAIRQANKSSKMREYAIGSVVVRKDKIISKGENRGFTDNDACSHSEIIAMKRANKKLKSKYLKDCILYTTHEPCCMCTGMAIWSRLKGIVFGANIKDMESYWKKRNNPTPLMSCKKIIKGYNSNTFVIKNFMRDECKKLFDINPR